MKLEKGIKMCYTEEIKKMVGKGNGVKEFVRDKFSWSCIKPFSFSEPNFPPHSVDVQ
jgi:hypothetical protein